MDGKQDTVVEIPQDKTGEVANPWIIELSQKQAIREGHEVYVAQMLGDVPTALEGGDEWKIQGLKMGLWEEYTKLEKIDEEILRIMAKLGGLDLSKEAGSSGKRRMNVHLAIMKLDRVLESLKPGITKPEGPSSGGEVTVKLPKLKLLTFDGQLSKWQQFWDVYERNIHGNPKLGNINKFSYLCSLLHGKAAKVIEGFQITSANYPEAITQLKERFGQPDLMVQGHVNDLLRLGACGEQTRQLRQFYDEIQVHHRALKALDVDSKEYSRCVVPALLRKLPEDVDLNITRGKSDVLKWKIDDLLEALKKELANQERREEGKKPSKEEKEQKPPKYRGFEESTASALLMKKTQSECAFCLKSHPSETCRKVTEVETRKSFFKKFGRCWNCSKKRHRVKECKSKNMCSCGGRHHPSICDGENYGKKVEEKETKLETKVSGLQVQTKQPEEPVELKELREVNVATTVKTGGGTALQTLQAIVTANGGEQSVRCRLLLDSACNKTFITTELAELFKANPKCTEMVNVSSFGKQKGSIRSDVYDVEIKGLDHKNKIKAEVFTVPTITTLPNSKPEVVKENYEHLKDLWFPDVSEKDTLEVHMLVGMDLLWHLQTGHSKRGTTEEPVAIETIFGWTLAGKIGGSNSSEMKVNVNLFIEEGGKNGIENNLKKIWDYETLGIRAKLRGKQKISDEFLHTEETEAARKMWLISAQEDLKKEKHFPELEKRLGIKENDGILRCYGRLDHAVLGEEAKHPVILPKHHPVTRLIVDSCHRHVLHGGTRNTLAEFRSQYWMGKAQQVIKAILRRCATCKRHQARPFNKPAPGQLPEFRVTPARPFQNCGVDFAGPLYVLRRKSMKKVYITLFTCGVTRAIHLELVPDLSAETFKQTLKKFTARRGTPSLMVSDNAKTFEATAKWLKKLYRDPTVQHFLQENNIRWRFNLSLAPWWGGFFERLVGLVKRTLRKVLGNARLRFEELETILIETEGMLNNRPLTYLYEEATEDVLMPNHLIFGHRLGTLPDAEVDSADEDTDEGKRMKYIRTRQQHLWNRWEKEYLTNLREHHEMGTSGSSKPEIGEVVLIKEEQTNRGKWKLGRIVSLIEGRDGIMRGATIRVISGGNPREIQRPIQKLYSMELKCRPDEAMPAERQLPVQPDEEARNVRPRRLAAMDGEIR